MFNWRLGVSTLALGLIGLSRPVRAFTLVRGSGHAYEKRDYEKAEKYFGEKAEKSPENTDNVYSWGNSLYQLGKYEEAEKGLSTGHFKRSKTLSKVGITWGIRYSNRTVIKTRSRIIKKLPAIESEKTKTLSST